MDLVRGLSSIQIASLRRSVFFPNVLVEIDWMDDPLRFHMGGYNSLTWGGKTFHGFGSMVSMQLPAESQGLSADSGSIEIAGVSHDLEGEIDSPIRGRAVSVWLALMDEVIQGSRIGEPIPLFQGTVGGGRVTTSQPDPNTQINRLIVDLNMGPSARASSSIYHSNEDQVRRFPGDTAGRLVILAYARAQKIRWPE